jgi:cold shock CspA family protein
MTPYVEEPHGPVEGTVKNWSDELGWGVVVSPDAPDDVWLHFSAFRGGDYGQMRTGDTVASPMDVRLEKSKAATTWQKARFA